MDVSRRAAVGGLIGAAVTPLIGTGTAQGQQIVDLGLPYLGLSTPRQNCPQWCWAASIQTIFGAHGYSIAQEYIVDRVMRPVNGNLPCRGATDEEMLRAINLRYADPRGRAFDGRYHLAKDRSTNPYNHHWWDVVKVELSSRRPLLAAYKTGPTTGHAVVITHVRIARSPGRQDQLIAMTVRDPWPGSPNRRSLTFEQLREIGFVAAVAVRPLN